MSKRKAETEPNVAVKKPATKKTERITYAKVSFESDDEEEEEEYEEEVGGKPKKKVADPTKIVQVPKKQALGHVKRIHAAVLKATGNGRGGFAMFRTSSSPKMMRVFKKELTAARKAFTGKDYREAFCVAFATFVVMRDLDSWFSDTEDSEGVEQMFTTMHALWTDILPQEDEVLGLKGRKALTDALKRFGDLAKESFCYKFPWFAE